MIPIRNSRKSNLIMIIGFSAVMGMVLYPICFAPMMDNSYYKKMQKIGRKDIDIEKVQPGNMKVWSDPFGPIEK